MRSWRAASRSEVWSSHLPYAASCCGELSSTCCSVPNIATPHGLMSSPSVPFSIAVPLAVDDRPGVADQLAGELAADVGREELGGLDLLGHGERLGLGAATGGVVALEARKIKKPSRTEKPVASTPKMPAARSLSVK